MSDTKLGNKIRTLREANQMTVGQLADRCGCDPSVIAGLENGDLAPSLAPLIKITRSLGVRLGTLMDDDNELGPVFTPAGAMESTTRMKSLETSSDTGVLSFFSLAEGKAARHMDPFIITIDPSGVLNTHLSSHEGEEFLYAMEGPVEIEYGKKIYVLEPGDSIYYDSIVPHEVRAHDGQTAKFLACVYTPV